MAAYFLVISALILVTNAAPAPPCVCEQDDAYLQKLFDFFDTEAKIKSFPVVSGELSPEIMCENCPGYNRRKREDATEKSDVTEKNIVTEKVIGDATVKPKVTEKVFEEPEVPVKGRDNEVEDAEVPASVEDLDYSDDTKPGVEDRSCPRGTKRVGDWCA